MFEALTETVGLVRGIELTQNPGQGTEQKVIYDQIELSERTRGMVMEAEIEAEIPTPWDGAILRLPSQAKFNDALLRRQIKRIFSSKNPMLPEIPGPLNSTTLNRLVSPDIELIEEAQERLLMRGREVGAVGGTAHSSAPDTELQRADDSPIVRAS